MRCRRIGYIIIPVRAPIFIMGMSWKEGQVTRENTIMMNVAITVATSTAIIIKGSMVIAQLHIMMILGMTAMAADYLISGFVIPMRILLSSLNTIEKQGMNVRTA